MLLFSWVSHKDIAMILQDRIRLQQRKIVVVFLALEIGLKAHHRDIVMILQDRIRIKTRIIARQNKDRNKDNCKAE